jgi:uncharacterized membrane protein YsdA (DUF1294 family)
VRPGARSQQNTRRRWRRPWLPFPPIVAGFLLAGAALTTASAWLLTARLQVGALLAYLAGVNLATIGAYLYDKSVAGGSALWRVPEAVLHLLALAGGTPAALVGQHLLRHKTRKTGFQTWFWLIVALQAALLGAWVWATRP